MKKTIENKDLKLIINEQESEITITWVGRSTERDPALFLTPIFNELVDTNKKLIMDFKNLEYMNSSTITPVLKAIDRLKKTTGSMHIVYAKDLKWQQMSFSALEIFQNNNYRIRIMGE
jgi:hypothetical protein